MAHKIKLSIDGKEYPLSSCNYMVYRDSDQTGKPAGGARAGQLSISRESSEDSFFYQWSIDNAARKSGSISFSKMNVEDTMKTLEFENAFVISYGETCGYGSQMMEEITISAQKLTISGATVDNDWPPGT
jgi:hypothetical protein